MMKHSYYKEGHWLPCVTHKQLASMLGIEPQGIYYHIENNNLPKSFKIDNIIYYDLAEIDAWIANRGK